MPIDSLILFPIRSPLIGLCLVAMTVALVGCGGSGTERAEQTSKSLDETRIDAVKGDQQIDNALASLAVLVDHPLVDNHKAYATFSAHVVEVDALAKQVDAKSKDLGARSDEYFKNWETENAKITDQDLRATSTTRRNDLKKGFGDVTNAYENTKTAFQPFLANLHDIQRYLANDLSATGIANIAPSATKAKEQGAEVKRDLATIQDRVDQLTSSMGANAKH